MSAQGLNRSESGIGWNRAVWNRSNACAGDRGAVPGDFGFRVLRHLWQGRDEDGHLAIERVVYGHRLLRYRYQTAIIPSSRQVKKAIVESLSCDSRSKTMVYLEKQGA